MSEQHNEGPFMTVAEIINMTNADFVAGEAEAKQAYADLCRVCEMYKGMYPDDVHDKQDVK